MELNMTQPAAYPENFRVSATVLADQLISVVVPKEFQNCKFIFGGEVGRRYLQLVRSTSPPLMTAEQSEHCFLLEAVKYSLILRPKGTKSHWDARLKGNRILIGKLIDRLDANYKPQPPPVVREPESDASIAVKAISFLNRWSEESGSRLEIKNNILSAVWKI